MRGFGRSGVDEGKVDRSVVSYSGNQMTHGLRLSSNCLEWVFFMLY